MIDYLKRNKLHFGVIAIMFVITAVYFNLQFKGFGLKQHDIEQFKGASHEIADYRERNNSETLWTNSMFGGMPSTQISLLYKGNYLKQALDYYSLYIMQPPAGIALMYMIGFYIFALCLRMNPWIGLLGGLAFGFASYDIIIIQAGHNTKAFAVALMAPVLGAFIMAYQRNLKWGILLSALFMVLELSMNHLQVTYYLGILLVAVGAVMLVESIRKKTLKNFAFATIGITCAYALGLLVNYGNISLTNDYAKHTIRGGNDITINGNGESNEEITTSGLDKDYITQWSYGVGESFTLVSPYVKGGGTVALAESPFADKASESDLSPEQQKNVANIPVYWGDQPMTSGPVYIGIVVIVLAIFGLVFVTNPIKWALLVVTLLTLALSWGKNFMGLTDFFLDHVPGYNKFRAVTIILVVVELCIPVIGVLFLDLLVKERELLKQKKKLFLITSGAVISVLFLIKIIGLGDNYTSKNDQAQIDNVSASIRSQLSGMDPAQLKQQYNLDVTNPQQMEQFVQQQSLPYLEGFDGIKKVREAIFHSSMNRSLLFAICALGLLALLVYTGYKAEWIIIGLVVFTALDLIPVANNYLGSQEQGNGYKYWTEAANTEYPMIASAADYQILEAESSNSPTLKREIIKATQEGTAKANELELSGGPKTNVIDAYKFAALNRNSNYRVFDVNGGFNSSNSSYFHKALGGYHGAKLRNIQNIFDFHLSKSNYKVFDMLNVKYFIQGQQAQPNPTALGNAWFVKSVTKKATPNEEILALGAEFQISNEAKGSLIVNGSSKTSATVHSADKLQYVLQNDTLDVPLSSGITEGMEALFVMDINGKTNLVPIQTLAMDTAKSFLKLVKIKNNNDFDPKNEAIVLNDVYTKIGKSKFTGEGTIQMTAYAPNKINYSSNSSDEQLAVFSEVYYPEGWKATIDGKEVDIIKVDYLLRGLKLPKGKHAIEFTFDLPKYHQAGMISSIASILIILGIGFGIYTDVKKRKQQV